MAARKEGRESGGVLGYAAQTTDRLTPQTPAAADLATVFDGAESMTRGNV